MSKTDFVTDLLKGVIHPETGEDIVSSGLAERVAVDGGRVVVTMTSARARDPFESSLRKQIRSVIEQAMPEFENKVDVIFKPRQEVKEPAEQKAGGVKSIKNIIAVSSGKGGVGKSTVASNLSIAMARKGYKVGLLDADIYGPSQPKMFGLEDYKPVAERVDGVDMMIPAENYGVKVMSIGFFISPSDALIWRGPMATNALRQLIHQTHWGDLDFLFIDMPPGTGDVHLTIIQELQVTGALVVTTPQDVALSAVIRGISMFRSEGVGVPVLGIIQNMAWFTPEELPDNRYYIFGRGKVEALAEREGVGLLAGIPLVQGISEGGDDGKPVILSNNIVGAYFMDAAAAIVDKCKE